MKASTLTVRKIIYISAAILAAHANSKNEGFRLRDIRFLFELFMNWSESTLLQQDCNLQSTQILRHLQRLQFEGYLKRRQKNKQPIYRLTRAGLIEMVANMTKSPQLGRGSQFFFVYHFIKCYSQRILELVISEGEQFPNALKIDLDELLDYKQLLNREIVAAKKELQKLDLKINQSMKMLEFYLKEKKLGTCLKDIIVELEKKYPYQLNSQKPYSELMLMLPEDSQLWELEVGNISRAKDLWIPEKALLTSYIKELEKL